MIEELYKAAEQEAPNEMCGLIIEQNGIEKFIKCKNLEDDKKNGFKIDPKLLIRYQLIVTTRKILNQVSMIKRLVRH
jgi:proteasome lid subunit RPN8/RPN11